MLRNRLRMTSAKSTPLFTTMMHTTLPLTVMKGQVSLADPGQPTLTLVSPHLGWTSLRKEASLWSCGEADRLLEPLARSGELSSRALGGDSARIGRAPSQGERDGIQDQ